MKEDFKIKDRIKFATNDSSWSGCYPRKGTIGTILKIDKYPNGQRAFWVQWSRGSTQGDDRYWCMENQVKIFKREDDYLIKD